MSNILGGFLGTVYTSSGYDDNSVATNIGIITRINPILDPGNIDVAGTGERGLYDILLGMREPQITLDMQPTLATFLSTYQNGQSAPAYLHVKFVGGQGLSFVSPYINRLSVEARHNEAINASLELWAAGNLTYPSGLIPWGGSPPAQQWSARVITPKRWLDSALWIATILETEWWSWRYEVANNLQRLGNVATGGTRAVKAKERRVTGMIIKDLDDFDEWTAIINLAAEMAKFNIKITLSGTSLLDCNYCRWGRIEAPAGPEDLIAKRFPFTATDLTTLTP